MVEIERVHPSGAKPIDLPQIIPDHTNSDPSIGLWVCGWIIMGIKMAAPPQGQTSGLSNPTNDQLCFSRLLAPTPGTAPGTALPVVKIKSLKIADVVASRGESSTRVVATASPRERHRDGEEGVSKRCPFCFLVPSQ